MEMFIKTRLVPLFCVILVTLGVFWGCQYSKNDANLQPNVLLDAATLASDKDFREFAILQNKITGQSQFLKKGTAPNRTNALKEMQALKAIYGREKNTGIVSLETQQRAAKSFGFTNVEDMNKDFSSLIEKLTLLTRKYPSLKEGRIENADLIKEAYSQIQKELPYMVVFKKNDGFFSLNKSEWRQSLNNFTTVQLRCCPSPWDKDCNNDGFPECGADVCPGNPCCERAMNKLQSKYNACDNEFFFRTFECLTIALLMWECPPCAVLFAAECEYLVGQMYYACLQEATTAYDFDVVSCGYCEGM